jgi:hypothetical protein
MKRATEYGSIVTSFLETCRYAFFAIVILIIRFLKNAGIEGFFFAVLLWSIGLLIKEGIDTRP